MTKSLTRNDPCAFSVEVKNEHRGRNRRVAYTRTVDAKIYGKVVRLAPNRKVYVSNEHVYMYVEFQPQFCNLILNHFDKVHIIN